MTTCNQIYKNAKLSNSEESSINQCLSSSQIYLLNNARDSLNPYCLYYTINTIYDCIKVFQLSITLDYFNLVINPNNIQIPNVNLTLYDTIGEDYIPTNNPIDSKSYIINTPTKNHFNLIIGNSSESIIDSFNKLTDLLITYQKESILEIGIFLSQVNPNKYLNRSFKLHRLKEVYSNFITTLNKYNNSTRLYIELVKSLLKYTSKLINIKYNYTNSTYQQISPIKKNILNTIKTEKYLASKIDLISRINNDVLEGGDIVLNNSNNTEELVVSLYKKKYKGDNIILLTNNCLVLSKRGVISADKLLKSPSFLYSGDKWVPVKVTSELKDAYIYTIFFTDNSCIEILEDSKITLSNGNSKSIREVVKGDCIAINSIYKNKESFIPNGVVDKICYERVDSSYIKIALFTKLSNSITLGNGIILESIKTEELTLSPLQIESRLSDNYSESISLVKDSIVLESKVNLTELDLLNITEQLKVFRAATLISSSSLNLSEHNLCPRLYDNLTNNPVINVCIEHIQQFNLKLHKLCTQKTVKLIDTYDMKFIHLFAKKELLNTKYSIEDNTIIITGLTYFKHKYILETLLQLWRNEVQDTISNYCTKHNLAIPHRITSILENELSSYNAIEQLNLICQYHKLFSTQNSIFTINYKEAELDKLSTYVTRLFKSESNLPYLIFNRIA